MIQNADQVLALAQRLRDQADLYRRFTQPCGHAHCPFMVRHGDGGWGHLDTHGVRPDHAPIGLLVGAAAALESLVEPSAEGTSNPERRRPDTREGLVEEAREENRRRRGEEVREFFRAAAVAKR